MDTSQVLPGQECPACHRKVPKVHDKPPTKRQTRFSVAEPVGEEGLLDEMLVQWQEAVQARWPEEVGELGAAGWRYRALHFGLYALTTASPEVLDQMLPSEVGG